MENEEFKIEKNFPIPKGGKWRTMLIELEVGDSVLIDQAAHNKSKSSLRSALFAAAALIGIKLATRTEGDKVRIWRIG